MAQAEVRVQNDPVDAIVTADQQILVESEGAARYGSGSGEGCEMGGMAAGIAAIGAIGQLVVAIVGALLAEP
jgi:hypothetical protein